MVRMFCESDTANEKRGSVKKKLKHRKLATEAKIAGPRPNFIAMNITATERRPKCWAAAARDR